MRLHLAVYKSVASKTASMQRVKTLGKTPLLFYTLFYGRIDYIILRNNPV